MRSKPGGGNQIRVIYPRLFKSRRGRNGRARSDGDGWVSIMLTGSETRMELRTKGRGWWWLMGEDEVAMRWGLTGILSPSKKSFKSVPECGRAMARSLRLSFT